MRGFSDKDELKDRKTFLYCARRGNQFPDVLVRPGLKLDSEHPWHVGPTERRQRFEISHWCNRKPPLVYQLLP